MHGLVIDWCLAHWPSGNHSQRGAADVPQRISCKRVGKPHVHANLFVSFHCRTNLLGTLSPCCPERWAALAVLGQAPKTHTSWHHGIHQSWDCEQHVEVWQASLLLRLSSCANSETGQCHRQPWCKRWRRVSPNRDWHTDGSTKHLDRNCLTTAHVCMYVCMYVCACVRACVGACVRACVRACGRVCVWGERGDVREEVRSETNS